MLDNNLSILFARYAFTLDCGTPKVQIYFVICTRDVLVLPPFFSPHNLLNDKVSLALNTVVDYCLGNFVGCGACWLSSTAHFLLAGGVSFLWYGDLFMFQMVGYN